MCTKIKIYRHIVLYIQSSMTSHSIHVEIDFVHSKTQRLEIYDDNVIIINIVELYYLS